MLAGCRKPKNIAVFISGGGSTLQALLEMQSQFSVQLVVSNKKNALGLLKAKRFGVPTTLFNQKQSYQDLTQILRARKIELIFLAGYMRILPADFVQQWSRQIYNIHPSLLPLYPGLCAAQKNYEIGDPMGVTIHEVTTELDQGKKLLQMRSLNQRSTPKLSELEAMKFLRRSEQHLLREFVLRKVI